MNRFLLTWAAAFLAVFAILGALGPLLEDWPLWLRALAVSGLMVGLMQGAVAPLVRRLTSREGSPR